MLKKLTYKYNLTEQNCVNILHIPVWYERKTQTKKL